jgi:hypothetical protein
VVFTAGVGVWRRILLFVVGPVALALSASCTGSSRTAPRTDVPEPAVAPPVKAQPAGRLVPVGGEPEGLAVDPTTHTLAVGVRRPDGVVLMSLPAGTVARRIDLDGAPRHLELAAPGGPLLVPAEGSDTLYQVSLPDGGIVGRTRVGRQPHDAAAAVGRHVLVGNELADTVSVIAGTTEMSVVPAPTQPGGVAASPDGSVVVVVGVRGRQVEAFSPVGSDLGRAAAGVGPTHVRSGPGGLFYVADTQGNAVLVFMVGAHGPVQIGRVGTGGTPYGLAVDATRLRLYVTLTATNELREYDIRGHRLVAGRSWPTPRQPNDVVVEPQTGEVIVAGTADNVLQFITP